MFILNRRINYTNFEILWYYISSIGFLKYEKFVKKKCVELKVSCNYDIVQVYLIKTKLYQTIRKVHCWNIKMFENGILTKDNSQKRTRRVMGCMHLVKLPHTRCSAVMLSLLPLCCLRCLYFVSAAFMLSRLPLCCLAAFMLSLAAVILSVKLTTFCSNIFHVFLP